MTEDEMAGWHHGLDEGTPGDGGVKRKPLNAVTSFIQLLKQIS